MAKTILHPCTLFGARLLVILTAAWLAMPTLPLALAAPSAAPLVYMSLTQRDFGDVFVGEELEQVFPVRNDGDAPLEMDNKSLTGQATPSPSPPLRAGAFYGERARALTLTPVALRRAAPS